MSTESIEARVARGVALLDERLPSWDERIDLDRLDLHSSCNCILGQEFANHEDVDGETWTGYDAAQSALLNHADPTEYGFDLTGREAASFPALTSEWKRLILARRGGEPGDH